MSALDFPLNPSNGQTYTLNGVNYEYNSTIGAWLTKSAGSPLPSATNAQILFNDNGLSNGSYGLVFSKSANTLYANAVNVSSDLRVYGNLQIGTGTVTITNNSISAASIVVGGSAIPSGAAANLAYATANAAYVTANAAYANSNTKVTTGKSIAMAIVFS